MHIKQISISNFRSFRQQPEIHPFSPATNTVVGRNGSGKSNLFDAVQFVLLSPKFFTLRTEERQALLHEGSGSAAVNAFVEIVFDNSDNRFSLENSDEVVLRRTVGHKKDELFLQRKRASKNEIMGLLEGAGFSKSNPYFIVQQGKVNALCTMSDTERLQLLKEVAGTTVYDEKKAESLAKMEENKSRVENINEMLSEIETRLNELRGEKDELTEYQTLDRERRAMEYTLYDKELRRARETLDEIEHARNEEIEAQTTLFEDARKTHDAITSVEALMKTKTNLLRRNRTFISGTEDDKTAAMTLTTKLELQCNELEENIRTGDEVIESNRRDIELLQQEILAAQEELQESVQPRYDDVKESLTRTKTERDEARKKIEGIYAKQGRGRQFATKEDRDAFLTSQIDELNTIKAEKEVMLASKRDSLANLRRSLIAEKEELESKSANVSKRNAALEDLTRSVEEKKKARNDMAEARKEQWRALEELNERVTESRDTARRAQSNLRKIMPRATALGLDALSRIVEEEGIIVGEQYFGLLMQNFELVEPKFQTAVEVAAQNALFHVIVDTDATAALLMRRLERDKLGRVTFLPLNQLRIDNVQYPDSSDVTPILSRCIRYDQTVHKAMQHVFGRKLLARTVDVASTWSAQSHMDAITLDGDLCSRKGALTGGFVDHTKSRLRAHAELHSSEETFRSLDAEHLDMQRKAQALDQQISSLMGETQRMEAQQINLEELLNRTEDEIAKLGGRIEKTQKQIERIESEVVPSIEVDIKSLEGQVDRLREEMETELSANLSEYDRTLLGQLKIMQSELDSELESQTQTLDEVSVERQRLQSLLDDNLLKRKKELEDEGVEASSRRTSRGGSESGSRAAQVKRREDLEQRRRERDEATRAGEEIEERLFKAKQEDAELRADLTAAKNDLEALRQQDAENSRKLESAQESSDRLLNKRSMCVSKRELYMRKIQELGSLPPSSELSKYTTISISALMRQLESINKQLKKYSHVNKKAYDQYVNFSEERESLLKRKDDLDNGAEKVKELVESLDRQKDDAINRTFRGVSSHFKDVFKELVPNGGGELIMRSALDEGGAATDNETEDSEDSNDEGTERLTGRQRTSEPSSPDVSLYRGVGIKVRFSAVGENYMMSQLSGGQKALVAMALIFSIQRCDPAPFYLFDELDQALDSTHRAAVAALVQRQANSEDNPTQFICSTFRPELVAIASRCYGISHQNKVSSVHHLSKKDALHFIANLMNEEETLGDITSLATSKDSKRRKTIESSPTEEPQVDEEETSDEENL